MEDLIQAAIKSKSPLLQNYRNLKTDFEYLKSKNSKLSDLEILLKMDKERLENISIYEQAEKLDLAQNEKTEHIILLVYVPREPSKEEVIEYLNSIVDIEKSKKNFRKFQEKCLEHFERPVDSKIILQFFDA